MGRLSRMALMAPKRAQEERNAAHALFTWMHLIKVSYESWS